jgi:hypothetical protein
MRFRRLYTSLRGKRSKGAEIGKYAASHEPTATQADNRISGTVPKLAATIILSGCVASSACQRDDWVGQMYPSASRLEYASIPSQQYPYSECDPEAEN